MKAYVYTELYTSVYRGFIHNRCQKKHPRQTWKQMSVRRLMGKQIVMYLYSVIVHSDTNELTVCNNIDES